MLINCEVIHILSTKFPELCTQGEKNMNQKKTLQELTFKDNFMFGAFLLDPENCKGVRLDAYAKDENNTRYNIEMQILPKPALQRRARYYHSQIDMELLLTCMSYNELPDTYVIFICDFDPFGKGKYRYTKKSICKEFPELEMNDGAHTIFLSTKGTNEDEVPKELVKFLKFVGVQPSESEKDFEDAFVQRLQKSVKQVKASREMGARYMTFQELLKDEREAGRKEGEDKLSKLISLLLADGLTNIVELVVNDEDARAKYYKKYNIK